MTRRVVIVGDVEWLAKHVANGTGALVLETRTLGEWSTVGAGSVADRDVVPDATGVGVPAHKVRHEEPGWQLSKDRF